MRAELIHSPLLLTALRKFNLPVKSGLYVEKGIGDMSVNVFMDETKTDLLFKLVVVYVKALQGYRTVGYDNEGDRYQILEELITVTHAKLR